MPIIKSLENWKRVTLLFALVGLFIVLTSGCSSSKSEKSSSAKPIELKFAHYEPTTNLTGKILIPDFAKALEQATNGRVKITIYPAETLLKTRDIYDGVVNKVADIGYTVIGYNPGLFPIMESTKVPGHPYDDWKTPGSTSQAVWDLYKKFNPKELQNVKVLLMASTANGGIQTLNKPVRTIEDLKGLQLGGTGQTVEAIKRLGATPIAITMLEAKEAMSKGVVDGYAIGAGPIKNFGLEEFVKHVTYAPFLSSSTFMVFMNLDTWNSLPPDIQKALEDESEKQRQQVWSTFWFNNNDLPVLKWAQDTKKLDLITLSPEETAKWMKVIKGQQDAYEQKLNQQGLPGKEIMDTFFRPKSK